MADRQWKGATFGNGKMHRDLVRVLRFMDVRLLYLFSVVFIVPFCIIFNRSRRTSFSFYHKRLRFNVLKSCWYVYRNHCVFAQVVIDKFAMYAGKKFKVEIVGTDYFKELEAKDDGFVQLSSHIGNYEIAGYSLRLDHKVLHAVVTALEKESVMNSRNSMFIKTNVSMIAIKEDMSHLFEINEALGHGDIISFAADRHMEGARCEKVEFLGKEAEFPQGPFSVASMRGVEVLAVNVMKSGLKKYKIHMKTLPYDKAAPRKEQIARLTREYVAELENMIRMYPAQWFNFFDFWT